MHIITGADYGAKILNILNDIVNLMIATLMPVTLPMFMPYLVKVTGNHSNVRKGAGANFAIVGSIIENGFYAIVEEATGAGAKMWGKLKSGTGWISLDYTSKV